MQTRWRSANAKKLWRGCKCAAVSRGSFHYTVKMDFFHICACAYIGVAKVSLVRRGWEQYGNILRHLVMGRVGWGALCDWFGDGLANV